MVLFLLFRCIWKNFIYLIYLITNKKANKYCSEINVDNKKYDTNSVT